MELRYALRELERVIGEHSASPWTTDTGEKIEYKHTYLSKRLRHEFYERLDAIRIAEARAAFRVAAMGNPVIPIASSRKYAIEGIDSLEELLFPYYKRDDENQDQKSEKEYISSLFSELERIKKEEAANGAAEVEAKDGQMV